jgi:hypothetical protein
MTRHATIAYWCADHEQRAAAAPTGSMSRFDEP